MLPILCKIPVSFALSKASLAFEISINMYAYMSLMLNLLKFQISSASNTPSSSPRKSESSPSLVMPELRLMESELVSLPRAALYLMKEVQ